MILTCICFKNPTAGGTFGLKYASDLALQRKGDHPMMEEVDSKIIQFSANGEMCCYSQI